MCAVPRVAIGSVFPRNEPSLVPWAMMEVLQEEGAQVQGFLSKAVFPKHLAAAAVTGRPLRYLDSWLMSPEQCLAAFLRIPEETDVAIVEGAFPGGFNGAGQGGRLDVLCRWLHLPRVGLIDVAQSDPANVSSLPEELDACLLENVENRQHFFQWCHWLEVHRRLPVLGALESAPKLRRSLDRLPPGVKPSRAWCHRLGRLFRRYWQRELFWQVACSRPLVQDEPPHFPVVSIAPKATVAIAYDEAFYCYFPEVLEAIESQGATIVTFSPLRDEGLPPDTSVVYIGCGHAEYYAALLSENHCMQAALRQFGAGGKSIYAEGAGAAYLCRQMDDATGRPQNSVGIFPAVARWKPVAGGHFPHQVTVSRSNWLAEAGTRLRGYRHPAWQVEPEGPLANYAGGGTGCPELFGTRNAIGSLVHLCFAVWPNLLERFLDPLRWDDHSGRPH